MLRWWDVGDVPLVFTLCPQVGCYLHCCLADPGRDPMLEDDDISIDDKNKRFAAVRAGRCSICRFASMALSLLLVVRLRPCRLNCPGSTQLLPEKRITIVLECIACKLGLRGPSISQGLRHEERRFNCCDPSMWKLKSCRLCSIVQYPSDATKNDGC